MKDNFKTYALLLAVIIIMGLLGFFTINKIADSGMNTLNEMQNIVNEQKKEYEEELLSAIEDGYTVYLDGNKVNAETIDVMLYKSSIDHERKVIYLTKNLE